MSIFLIGALGWGLDGAQMYAQRQMAQAAADAAAQAAIMSIFAGTNTGATYGGSAPYTTPATYSCTATDTTTACKYAKLNGFSPSSDTVALKFGDSTTTGAPSVTLDAKATSPVSWMTVTVTRNVSTIFMRIFGVNSTTVIASGTAAIVDVPSSVPIIVTHPTNSGSLSFNGNPTIKIVGGPSQSVEVNSSASDAVNTTSCSNATVDLSLAGPGGNGADFGVWAQHNGPNSACFTFLPGTKPGRYQNGDFPITDPLINVPVPSSSGLTTRADPPPTVSTGTNGCPSTPTCPLYQPGIYSSGITVKASNTNGISLFAPGMYYISGGGFNMSSNSAAQMATGMSTDPNFPEIGTAGMVVFNTGTNKADIFSFDANAGAASPITLVGAPDSSQWKGLLFYEDPTTSGGTHLGTGPSPGHTIQGGGTINLTGTIYMSTRTGVDSTHFQNLSLQGASGSTTTLTGEIIVNTLSLGGKPTINMTLDSQKLTVRQVALVQ